MAEKEKKKVGCPPMYKTVEQMKEKIEEYFELCEGEPYFDEEGKPFFTDKGVIIYKVQPKPPTVTGLALALGFASRQALLNYQGKDEFNDTITRAKSRVEEYAETRLFDKEGSNGAKFSLANNFEGWREKQSLDLEGMKQVIINGEDELRD
ncbi:MAG: hypothetical protein IJN43_13750 [Ruminococcus sp.]|nr:hypothetical protein [Ruminococcus sp.]